MNIFSIIWQWRKRRQEAAEEKKKLLRERLARVFDEPPRTHPMARPQRVEPRYRETAAASKA